MILLNNLNTVLLVGNNATKLDNIVEYNGINCIIIIIVSKSTADECNISNGTGIRIE